MSTINPRWLRRGRIVYNSDTDFALLLHSPEPGRWMVAASNGMILRRSSTNLSGYNKISSGINNLKITDESKNSLRNIRDAIVDAPVGTIPTDTTVVRAIERRIGFPSPTLAGVLTPKELTALSSGAIKEAIDRVVLTPKDAARASGKFEVAPYDPDSFWYESDEDASLYRDFITLRKQHHPINMLIAGPSGSGKTEGIIRLGRELGIPVHIVNCQAITTPEKWIGQMTADMESGTRFIPSQHIEWVERTSDDCEGFDSCILLYDEITRLRPELNNMTYSLFDTQRGLEVPQMGRRVVMAQENMIVATANIGSAFTGTHTQDRAFRERFAITMERSFPPVDEEIKVLVSSTGVTKSAAEDLVRVADSSRKMWSNDEVESPISTRTLKAWALLCKGGYSIKKAAEYTVIPLYSNDGGLSSDRTKVASLIEGKVR